VLALAYGADNKQLKEGRIAVAQGISGTGSLRLGMQMLSDWYPNKNAKIFTPSPTWPLHNSLVEIVGRQRGTYRYYDPKTKGLDFNGMLDDMKNAENGSIFLLHVCAHNPTGVDPTQA
jgi:aspartate aminotransferase